MAGVTERYATALFDLSVEEGSLETTLEQAKYLRTVLAQSECESVLRHPKIHSKEKRSFLENTFGGEIHPTLMGFLTLAVEKSRESAIIPSLATFVEMGKKYCGVTTANIASATELSQEQIDAIAEVLSRKLNKTVEVFVKTEPSLIGGMIIQVEGTTIDHTVRKQIDEMKATMRNV